LSFNLYLWKIKNWEVTMSKYLKTFNQFWVFIFFAHSLRPCFVSIKIKVFCKGGWMHSKGLYFVLRKVQAMVTFPLARFP